MSLINAFRADEAMISRMFERQDIEFVADRVEGKLTVTEMKRGAACLAAVCRSGGRVSI